jgi:hypothetical protein
VSRRRDDKNNLYCPSTELKMLMEYLEVEALKLIGLSWDESTSS